MAQAKIHRYMLIDGNALIHRGFHAIPFLTTKSGQPTNAVYGFTMILLRAIKDLKPTHIACTFDLAGPTFRHDSYAEYKATRVKAAPELYDQIPKVKEVVSALNIPIFEKEGFEADDLLGTLATTLHKKDKDAEVMIVTGDLDTLQLVNHKIKIYTLRKGLTDVAVYDSKAIKERYGLTPEQMIDYKALRGDPSDNIKGVSGIGEKGASELILDFGNLENLYKQINSGKIGDKIKPRVLALLKEQEAQARQSYELSKIICDIPLSEDVNEYTFTEANLKQTLNLFKDLEFKTLATQLPKNYVKGTASNKKDDLVIEPEPDMPDDWKAEYVFVDNESKLKTLIKKLQTQKEFAIDTETTSLDTQEAKLVGVSISFKAETGYYIPASLVKSSIDFQTVIADQSVIKIGHNIKYDYLVLENEGIKLSPVSFDTMIASYLLNAGTRQHGLDASIFNEFGHRMQSITELIGKGKDQITMDKVDPEKVSWYASEDADAAFRLKEVYAPQLIKEGLDKVFNDIEMPLIEVLAKMERAGIKVNSELLHTLSKDAVGQIAKLETEIYKLAGQEFNISSPKQMKEILFDSLGLYSVTNKKTKTGLSTAAGELEKMADQHEIIPKILNYRELTKLQSTYLDALPKIVNQRTGRIHTSYNQTIAATGRLSSTDPNLQNIPIRGTGLGAEVRKAFIAEKGYKLLSIDYSQIELRMVAHLSKDKNMLKVFKNNEDIHTNTAMGIFGVTADKVVPDMRRDAKTINFGVLYGLSSFGLSSRIGEVSRSEAKDFIDKYFSTYPGIKKYIEEIKKDVNQKGFVRNELGRMRKFPEIKSSQFFIRAAAERAAVNFPIQSLAADVIKIAMINLDKELLGHSDEIKMLLQVHDELVFEVKEDKVGVWAKKIIPIMENAIKLSVPVTVEAKAGPNWGEMEKV